MRILIVNKFYDLRGGTERVMFDLAAGLRERGHEIVPFSMEDPRNEESEWRRHFVPHRDYDRGGFGPKLRNAMNLFWDTEARRCLDRLLEEARPDVAHLHNIYHQLSPSVLSALRDRGVPSFMTLHDYKLACPSYTMFRDGRPCEDCIGKRLPWGCAIHTCSRGSRAESLLLSLESTLHRAARLYQRGVDRFIAPSRFLRDIMLRHGIEPDRIEVIPNAPRHIGEIAPSSRRSPTPRVLYAGRLSAEKGVDVLVRAAVKARDVELVIAGEGPLGDELRALAADCDRIRFTGKLDPDALARERAQSWVTAMPSVCYENAPLAVLESFASGRPALVSAHGGLLEMIEHEDNGLHVAPGAVDAWSEALRRLGSQADSLARMGERARARLLRDYDFDRFVARHELLFQDAPAG